MPANLTRRQRDALFAIQRHEALHQTSPTARDIGTELGIRAQSAHDLLKALDRKGVIERTPGATRTIRVVPGALGEVLPIREVVKVPVYGPMLVEGRIDGEANQEGWLDVDRVLARRGPVFGFHVQDDSMDGMDIRSGDRLVVRRQTVAEDGDVVVAALGDTVLIRRFQIRGDRIDLVPAHADLFATRVRSGEDFRILGKVVGIYRSLKAEEVADA